MFHNEERAAKRLGFVPDMGKLLAVIHAGDAKFVGLGHLNRLIYDVPFEGQVVRVVVNERKTIVITVLPPKLRSELYHERRKKAARDRRHFRDEEEQP